MYGRYPENPEEAIAVLMGEDLDAPKDCHQHCVCWESEGECCDCGDVRTPNHQRWEAPLFPDDLEDEDD